MRIIVALVLALAFAGPALADSVTFGSRVLSSGDSVGRVYEVAGKPDRIVRLENKYGGAMGERLEYYRDGKTILITITGGKVVSIEQST